MESEFEKSRRAYTSGYLTKTVREGEKLNLDWVARLSGEVPIYRPCSFPGLSGNSEWLDNLTGLESGDITLTEQLCPSHCCGVAPCLGCSFSSGRHLVTGSEACVKGGKNGLEKDY